MLSDLLVVAGIAAVVMGVVLAIIGHVSNNMRLRSFGVGLATFGVGLIVAGAFAFLGYEVLCAQTVVLELILFIVGFQLSKAEAKYSYDASTKSARRRLERFFEAYSIIEGGGNNTIPVSGDVIFRGVRADALGVPDVPEFQIGVCPSYQAGDVVVKYTLLDSNDGKFQITKYTVDDGGVPREEFTTRIDLSMLNFTFDPGAPFSWVIVEDN